MSKTKRYSMAAMKQKVELSDSARQLHAAAEMRIQELFTDAIQEKGGSLSLELRSNIADVISGSHKTFKYMLMTGLLAAVTDEHLDPLSLQASAGVAGAYDARSLAMYVLVPFEKNWLRGRLGASNEPGANKPMRYPTISLENKVRAGKDAALLKKLYFAVSEVKTLQMPARETAFKFALQEVLKLPPNAASVAVLPIDEGNLSTDAFFGFLDDHTKGESAVATLAGYFSVFYSKDTVVKVHPSTESGASSKEIGDIDLEFSDGRVFAVEVKDKVYSTTDVNHACEKAAHASVRRVIFARGSEAEKVRGIPEMALLDKWSKRGVELTFLDISDVLSVAMAVSDGALMKTFAESIYVALATMNAASTTLASYKKHFKVD